MVGAVIDRPRVGELIWDDWNQDHIAKHAVLPEEAEEVFAGAPVVHETYKQRLQVIGPTLARRMLSIVVGRVPAQPDSWYVFSARPASRKERAFYAQAKGGSSK